MARMARCPHRTVVTETAGPGGARPGPGVVHSPWLFPGGQPARPRWQAGRALRRSSPANRSLGYRPSHRPDPIQDRSTLGTHAESRGQGPGEVA